MSQRVTDADLRALVSDEVFQPEVVWKLHDLQVNPEFTFQIFCSLSNLAWRRSLQLTRTLYTGYLRNSGSFYSNR